MSQAIASKGLPPQAAAAPRPGFWRRVFDTVWYAQQRRAQRDIARVVANRNGLITDALEHEIGQRTFRAGWDPGR
jgi:hypothetical protein